MNAIKGVVKNGRIEIAIPPDWPEGMEVRIGPLPATETDGLREEDWSDTPEGIASWRKWYDSLEPLIMTPEEKSAWQVARSSLKDFEKARFFERAEKLRRMWP